MEQEKQAATQEYAPAGFIYTEGMAAALCEESVRLAMIRHFLDGAIDAAFTQWDDLYAFDYLIGNLEIAREQFLKDHPDQCPASSRLKKEIAPSLRRQVFERDKYRCVHCGSWEDLACDHVLAKSKGGPTTIDNLQTLCRSCNSSKGAR